MNQTQRLHGLDFLRASMMLLGIVLHGAQMYMTMQVGFDYYKDPQLSPLMDGILIFINTFRMPVFFFLSGFFTALLYERYAMAGMWSNRYRRIVLPFILLLPPVALVLTLQWISASQLMATGAMGLNPEYVAYPWLLYDNTHHLWFLYYLIFILTAWTLLLFLWERTPQPWRSTVQGFFLSARINGVLLLVLSGLLIGCLALPLWTGRINGGVHFLPYWRGVLYFGLCFAGGWGFWYRRELLATLERTCWRDLGVATFCFLLALAAFFLQGEYGSADYSLYHPLLALANGISVVFYIAGFTGLFSRYFSAYNPRIRYLSDSAYWVYILHQTGLILFAVPMYHWQVAAEIKFVIVCVGTTLLCLGTYDLFVRNSWLGALLNGRRYPRGLPRQSD